MSQSEQQNQDADKLRKGQSQRVECQTCGGHGEIRLGGGGGMHQCPTCGGRGYLTMTRTK